ncbi:hypothetical protein FSP39_011347 [Pinctada imbricata]|uniref:Histone deacetylase n=1 Tax=Pinctada imbricata TaxID=66713 RepID=A0AA88YWW1_PINIB|nr:hypothetical protein FSP39_011347 [Pinctada imbricata]
MHVETLLNKQLDRDRSSEKEYIYRSDLDVNYLHINQSPMGSPNIQRRHHPAGVFPNQDAALQQELVSLKQQQDMQQQLLLQQFRQQQQQLAQEHEKQIQEHIKVNMHLVLMKQHQEFLDQQKKLEERHRLEKEMLEKERLEQIKNKRDNERSAVASSEVKAKLQEFVLTRTQREAARNSPPQFRQWMEQSSPPQAGLSPPYGPHLLGKYEDDFPLRKTASEPNLKVRSALKQKLERRVTHSPLLRRKEKAALFKRKAPLSIDCSSNSDSGPNSPPAGLHGALANGNLPSKEDPSTYPFASLYRSMGYHGTDLYPSPSMPNISLGRPPSSSGTNNSSSSPTEAELRAARLGMSIPSHMMPAGYPMYPIPPAVLDGEYPPQGNQAYISAQIKALEEARSQSKLGHSPLASPFVPLPGASTPGSAASEAHQARIHRHHKPLGRTHSAPLPIGHPFLQQQSLLLQQQQQQQQQPQDLAAHPTSNPEQALKDKLFVKQHIRQAVLQRVGSKSHMENVDEETEAKLAQEMRESREQDVVVIKDHGSMEESSSETERPSATTSTPDRETFPSHRELVKPRPRGPSHHRPLARTQSSPLVTLHLPPQQSQQESQPMSYKFTTGIAYDTIMHKHQCQCGNNANHPEHAGRLQSIWSRLQERGLISRCERIRSRKASVEELQCCHTESHALLYGTNPLNRQRLDPRLFENVHFCMLPCGGIGVDSDTVWNEMHTYIAARTAAGCVTELATRVANRELKNGFAVVRPPGHHAESNQAMGFCYFNNIAIAAKQLREKSNAEKVLIVDWDVHHGNSTQQIFYSDPSVLYISIHRHDNGNFFPGTGSPSECGEGEGAGFNVNIAFGGSLEPPLGDAEYLAAFRTLVMPIAKDFKPDIVLVSAGFDAAVGHPAPLGGYLVSPACFGHMTRELMSLADGKVVLALEGGYDLTAICDSSEMCIKALLGDELPPVKEEELCRVPYQPALETLEQSINIQTKHWPSVQRFLGSLHYSLLEAQKREMEEADTVSALASLSMVTGKRSGSMEQETEPVEEAMEEEQS